MPIVNGQWVPPSNAAFQAQFFRDFPYAPATDPNNLDYVTGPDLTNASNEAVIAFNAGIFGNNADLLFFYLWAHYLSLNLQNAAKGIAAQAQFAQESIGVGSVSMSNQIADEFKNNPLFSALLSTAYGRKYLEMAYPYTVGAAQVAWGQTTSA